MKQKLCYALLGAVLLAGCSNANKNPYQDWSAHAIYASGHTYLQTGNNTAAITAYQALDAQYPFESFSQKADLDIIYAYYQADEPTLALAAASRYLMLYPNGPDLDYAYYMRGVIEFDNGRGFLQRYAHYDMSQHHTDNYTAAFSDFKIVLTQYPNSPYAPDARRRMIYLNNTLAQYQLNVANFNFQHKAYVGAINRAKQIILYYPNTPAASAALSLMQQSYTALNLPDAAHSIQQVIEYNQTLAHRAQDSSVEAPTATFTANAPTQAETSPKSPDNASPVQKPALSS